MKHSGDIRVAQGGGGASFAEETLLGLVAVEEAVCNDLQRHVASQTRVERLVGNAHGAASQFEKGPVVPSQNLKMLELHRLGHPATVPQSLSFDNTGKGKIRSGIIKITS